jgi:hypothetical protein
MNLIQAGLQAHGMALAVNNAAYTRIVRGNEQLADVQFEADIHQCFVWADPELCKVVICRNRPRDSYIKAHAKNGTVATLFTRHYGPRAA